MKLRTRQILASLSLLLLIATVTGRAQPADEFFHGGAQLYLSNNIPAALETVTNGLQRFPDDAKLKKLYELLNQQQQQQDQKDQQQDKKDDQKQDQKQDQQKQDEKKDQDSKSDQQKKDEQKKQEAKDKEEQEKKDRQKANPDDKKESDKPQQVAAHAMTPQEAKQMLDAQKGDEQVLLFKPEADPKRRDKQLKDW